MIIVGFDPGITGAVGVIDTDRRLITVHDMPGDRVVINGKTKRRLNAPRLAAMLRAYQPAAACAERVFASPQQGVSSAFAFGGATEVLDGVCAGLGITLTRVLPGKWKSDLRVPADKGRARSRALELIPALGPLLTRALDHNRAEAALIALWFALSDPATSISTRMELWEGRPWEDTGDAGSTMMTTRASTRSRATSKSKANPCLSEQMSSNVKTPRRSRPGFTTRVVARSSVSTARNPSLVSAIVPTISTHTNTSRARISVIPARTMKNR